MLEIQDMHVYYNTKLGDVKAVDGVSFKVFENEIFGIAGESGCGKSTLVGGILRIVKPPAYVKSGRVIFEGVDLLSLNKEELNKLRWERLSYVPQGSMNSLNPVLRINEQMMDAMTSHVKISKEEARNTIISRLKEIGLPPEVSRMYPHELSGGMKQRTIIAMATLLEPSIVVADEPVTALDVVVQRVVLETLVDLRNRKKISIIFVTHDMAAHAEIVDRIAIMYAGKIVEIGSSNDVFLDSLHPYTSFY